MGHIQLVSTNGFASEIRGKVPDWHVGALLNLLARQWADDRCSLPDDPAILQLYAGWLGCPWDECEELKALFPPHPDLIGRVANPMLLERFNRASDKAVNYSNEDMQTALWIWELVSAMQPSRKLPDFESWANEVRKMRTIDGRSISEIRALFTAVNSHNFWQRVILSPDKLRAKWDNLVLQTQEHHGRQSTTAFGARRSPSQPARIAATAPKMAKVQLGG